MVVAAPVAFYAIGFSTHPHHVLKAAITTGIVVEIDRPRHVVALPDPDGASQSDHRRRPRRASFHFLTAPFRVSSDDRELKQSAKLLTRQTLRESAVTVRHNC